MTISGACWTGRCRDCSTDRGEGGKHLEWLSRLVPVIHVPNSMLEKKDVDARHKASHDDN
jgi:hypothetical protein